MLQIIIGAHLTLNASTKCQKFFLDIECKILITKFLKTRLTGNWKSSWSIYYDKILFLEKKRNYLIPTSSFIFNRGSKRASKTDLLARRMNFVKRRVEPSSLRSAGCRSCYYRLAKGGCYLGGNGGKLWWRRRYKDRA